jgi:glycosyltransferase involved in cell wall biosynthesis
MSEILFSACVVTHRRCDKMLNSIVDLVDEAVIWCTTEPAKAGVGDWVRNERPAFRCVYPYIAWRHDFSGLRNETIQKARGEWVLYIDSDEWVVEELADAASRVRWALEHEQEADAFFIPFWNWLDEAKTRHSVTPRGMIRIFRREKALFEGRIDNALTGFKSAKVMHGIRIEHDGYDSPEKMLQKAEERKHIYEAVLAEEPDSWKDWYHYAKNRFVAQDLPGCIAACERAISLLLRHGLLGEHTSYVDIYRVLARARLALSNFHGAEEALLGGHDRSPGALTVAPRYSDAYYELYLIHGLLADHYSKCWQAELAFRKDSGELPPYDLVHLGEEEMCES